MLWEEKWGVKLEVEHRVWPWLVEHAPFVDEGVGGSRWEDGVWKK